MGQEWYVLGGYDVYFFLIWFYVRMQRSTPPSLSGEGVSERRKTSLLSTRHVFFRFVIRICTVCMYVQVTSA